MLGFLFDTGDSLKLVFAELNALARPFTVIIDTARSAWVVRPTSEGPRLEQIPPFQINAAEPTCAGDAFTTAVISGLIANDWASLDEEDVGFSSAVGALTTTRPRAIDSLPIMSQVNDFLNRQRSDA
jgi:sugar/nucleoside kinase (ribokinase family)